MHRLPTPLRIAVGFLPWMIYGLAAGRVDPLWQALLPLLTAILLAVPDVARGRLKAPDLVAAVFFAAHVGATLGGWPVFQEQGLVLVHGALALMAWGSLAAGSPFTLQYARESWPEVLWDAPQFKAVNAAITTVWALCFTGGTAVAWQGGEALVVGGPVLLATGIAASVILPEVLPRRALDRSLRARDPWPWAPPVLTRRTDADHDVAVIGAGIGGLTAAAVLAARGAKVLVCEGHDRPGGYCSSWTRKVRMPDGRHQEVLFDAGVHDISGLGPDGTLTRLLDRLGVSDRLSWVPMEQAVTFPFGTLTIGRGADAYAEALAELVPAEAEGLRALVAEMERFLADLGRSRSVWGAPFVPATVAEALAYPAAHPHAFRWMDRPWTETAGRFVRTPEGLAAANALSAYLTDTPEKLTTLQMAPLFAYAFDGGKYPVGGSQRLADVLAEVVTEAGGTLRLRTPVSGILVEDGAAAGIVSARGETFRAGAVVMNGEARRLPDLLPPDALPTDYVGRLTATEPGPSAFMMTLLLDHVPEGPALRTLRDADIGIFAAITPRAAKAAPTGCAAVSLIRLVPHHLALRWDRSARDYDQKKAAFGDATLALAERLIPGLRTRLLYRQDSTPATFARYTGATAGAIYGPAIDADRPRVRTPIPGLVLAGASVQPGSGVEAVAISGLAAADALIPATAASAATSTAASRWSASASSAASTPAA